MWGKRYSGENWKIGGRTKRPKPNSLRLLPFGPDRVGEQLVRLLSRRVYGVFAYPLQAYCENFMPQPDLQSRLHAPA